MSGEAIDRLRIDPSGKRVRPGRGRRRALLAGLFAAALLAAALLYQRGLLTPVPTVDVTTASLIYPAQSLSLLNASGYVVAQRKAAVASRVTGRLVALLVEEGSRVKAGEVIARMANADVTALRDQAAANLHSARAALAQARAELSLARSDHDRYERLAGAGYVSRADYEAVQTRFRRAAEGATGAEAAVRAAEAALVNAGVSLEDTLIRAPFDAVVLTKNADVGDIVTPLGAAANAKAAVVTIADMGSLQVEADVSETNITRIRVGQPCDIQLDALPERRFRGEVHAVVPTVDRSKATVLVKVRFLERDSRMLPEMSAKVAFLSRRLAEAERAPRLAVLTAALVPHPEGAVAWRVVGERAGRVLVRTGVRLGDQTEILAGLQPGERVVLNPSDRLREGVRIRIAER